MHYNAWRDKRDFITIYLATLNHGSKFVNVFENYLRLELLTQNTKIRVTSEDCLTQINHTQEFDHGRNLRFYQVKKSRRSKSYVFIHMDPKSARLVNNGAFSTVV